jgi:hypothetical protein
VAQEITQVDFHLNVYGLSQEGFAVLRQYERFQYEETVE